MSVIPVPGGSGDPTERLSGRLVAGLVDFLLVAIIGFGAVALVSPGPKPSSQWVTLTVGLVALAGLRHLARTGHVRAAALALCVIAWLAIAMDLPEHGPNTIAVGGFVIVVVIGGLTLGPTAALALAAATGLLLASVMLGLVGAGDVTPSSALRLTHYATQLTLASLLVAGPPAPGFGGTPRAAPRGIARRHRQHRPCRDGHLLERRSRVDARICAQRDRRSPLDRRGHRPDEAR
jgi:hypothetical protein